MRQEQENKDGFSICIPIYNCDVSLLTNELHRQAGVCGRPYEILLMDDGSLSCKEKNSGLPALSNVSYIELKENVGRAKIRNRLAEKARYPYLIFLDCDVRIEDPHFLDHYLSRLPADVIIGGYKYREEKPPHVYRLRWKYGKKREERSAAERSKNPNKSFSTFNFLIRKEIAEEIRFDETLSGYGHEDTLFGWMLKKKKIRVEHIDNPVLHAVLDDNEMFLEKTENSLRNLLFIFRQISEKKEFIEDNKVLKAYALLEKYHLLTPFRLLFKFSHSLLRKNLLSRCYPSIFLFDIYKLGILAMNRPDEK